jgi:3-hydroxyacyl-[acyl-carrier-protein] dehydratase
MTDTFLLNDFYTLASVTKTDPAKLSAEVVLNAGHAIFKGHFEQMPIVPGVCQTQMIKELLQEELNLNLTMVKGSNIKFMGMIIPQQHPKLTMELEYSQAGDTYTAEAKLFHESTTFTKFKGDFTVSKQ